MARCTFGGGSADFVMSAASGGFIRLTSATLYVWPTASSGTQITDLLLANGTSATTIPVGNDGQVPVFSGPNDGTSELWVSAGLTGARIRLTSGVSSATDAVVSGLVANPASATGTALSAAYVAGATFSTVAALMASTHASIAAGSRWSAGGNVYREAASAATDHHVTTAGGVKLYVVPVNGTVKIEAWGVDSTTVSIKTHLEQAAAIADRIVLNATTYNLATMPTLDADLVGRWGSTGGAVINLAMTSGGGLTMLDRRRIYGVKFTSPYSGPASALDNADAAGGGKYDYGARGITLGQYGHVEDIEIENVSAGLHANGPRITGKRVYIHGVRQYKGWGSAIHLDSSAHVFCHFEDLFIENADRGIEVEAGASYNTFESGLLQNIGPAGYTGQPGDYANYTFVLDVHSHVGEGACRGNVYRHFRLYNCMGGITCLRSNGSNDSDLPRNNTWEDILIEGRVGTSGFDSVHLQGHGNKALGVRLLPGSGVTSRMRCLIDEGGTNNEVEVTEATGYMLPLVKVGTGSSGRGDRVKIGRVFAPDAGTAADWLVDVNHPDTTVDIDVHNVTGTVGYCRLGANAAYSKIKGYYSVAAGTSMTQALRVAGAKNARIEVEGVAGAAGVLDVYATNSTAGLVVDAQVDRTSAAGASVNLDSTTSGCKITAGSTFGTGTIVNAGVGNTRGGHTLIASPAGKYLALSGPSVGAAQFSNGALRLVPVYVGAEITIDRLGAEVTVVGDTGCVVRLGIYTDQGGLPGTALVDTTIPGDAVAVAEATITATLLTPGWYWVGGTAQGVTTTAPTVRTTSGMGANFPILGATAANVEQSAQAGQTKTGVTGALPAFGTTPSPVTTAPRLVARLA